MAQELNRHRVSEFFRGMGIGFKFLESIGIGIGHERLPALMVTLT